MKILLTIFLSAICSSCADYVTSQTKTVSSESVILSVPEGWVLYPSPAADSSALQCANYSRREWKVEPSESKVKIRLDKLQDHQASLPAIINSRSVAVGTKGYRSVEQVDDGWLVGLDVGEFGGGLWWFSSDGKSSKKLSEDRIKGFAKTSTGVFAVTGLAHLSFDDGKILQIGNGTAGNRKIQTLADLGSAPQAFVVESSDSLLILTIRGLVRVKTSGITEQLLATKYQQLYPNSMILLSSGVIYVGMRHFVTRLTPTENRYKEEWFVPDNCTQFKERDYDCVCLSKEK